MKLASRDISVVDAEKIMGWHYPYPYDFYNGEASDENRSELLNGTYRAVTDEAELFGFYCTGASAQVPVGHEFGAYPEGPVDFGLGMKPDQTGAGRGVLFVAFVIQEIESRNPGSSLRLTVAKFNRRAIRLYEQAGFVKTGEFEGEYAKFHVMLKENG